MANAGWPGAEPSRESVRGETTVSLFLLLLLMAFVLGVIGVAAEGLFYLFVIGVAVLIVDLVLVGVRLGRRGGPAR